MSEISESRVRQVFDQAMEKPAGLRAEYLQRLCGGDEALHDRVAALLAASDDAGEFLAPPTAPPAAPGPARADSAEEAGTTIGRYKLLQEIGEGGMGTVWMAEQFEPVRRKVALKIIKLGMDTRQVVVRFEAERQALALMDHPNIAKVLDGGVTETGRPYFVMELVKGVPITEFCDEAKLGLRERLELFTQVCQAVQHAHQKGIVHRDLKPSNVLVTLHDGRPVPKVIDFGIAKATNQELTQKTLFTEYAQILGTPEYMAPEQAAMSGLDIDTRADVYSLGVLLYELLTGTKPFDIRTLLDGGYEAILRTIREVDPPKPSTRASSVDEDTGLNISIARQMREGQLGRALRGDLDWIVVKAMEKDRTRRYGTANGLAADILRFLADEPVSAMPPSAAYRARKFVRRNRGPVTAAALVLVVLVLGIIGTGVGLRRALAETSRAERAERKTARELARAEEVKSIVKQMILGIKPEEAQGVDTTLIRHIVDGTAERLDRGEIEDERIAAEMHMLLGNAYATIGAFEAAEPHLAKAVRIRTRVLGPKHADTLEARAHVALLRNYQGQYRESARILEEVVPIARRQHEPDDDRLLNYLQNLSTTYWNLHRVKKTEAVARESYELAMRERGADSDYTLSAMTNLATAANAQGRRAEAIELWTKVLEARRRIMGPDHPGLIASLTNLASAAQSNGNLREAESLLAEARRISDRVLDGETPRAIHVAVSYARLQVAKGDTAEAEKTLLAALETVRRKFSPEHRTNLDAKQLLARIYAQEGRQAEAARLAAEGTALARRILGERTPRALTYLTKGAETFLLLKRFKEARELLVRVHEVRKERLGANHPDTVASMVNLAYARAGEGDAAGAVDLAREGHERHAQLFGEDDRRTDRAMRVLAFVLARAGQVERATELYQESVARQEKGSSAQATSYRELSDHLARFGRLKEAAEARRKEIAIMKRVAGPLDMSTLNAKRTLGAYLHHLGQFPEAQRVYDEVLPQLRKALGPAHALTIEVECQAAITLGAQRNFQKAEALLLDVVRRVEEEWGKQHLLNGEAHRCLGRVYIDWRRIPDAERVSLVAVEVHEALTGAPQVADLSRLAVCARMRNDPAESERWYARAVAVGRRTIGKNQPALVPYLAGLAEARQAMARPEEAALAVEEGLAIARAKLPETHPQRLRLLGLLASIRNGQGKSEEAVATFRELIEVARKKHGEASPIELDALMNFGFALNGAGRFDESVRTMRKGIEDAKRQLGPRNGLTGRLQMVIAEAYHAEGRWAEAEQALQEAGAAIKARNGANSMPMHLIHLSKGLLFIDAARPADAIAVLEPSLNALSSVVPESNMIRLGMANALVRAYADAGRTEDARPLLLQILPHQLESLESAHPKAGEFQTLAESLLYRFAKTHDPNRALELAQRACDLDEANGSVTLWGKLRTLARAQSQTGDHQGARATLERALELAPKGRHAELERLQVQLAASNG
jgi:tetratricopeptide (TPR) repeat protein